MRQRSWMVAILSATSMLALALLCTRISIADEISSSATTVANNVNGGISSPDGNGDADKPSATILNSHEVQGLLGSPVRSAADEDMGRVVDVIVDGSGTARAAVIDFGGFLGVGSRKIAVDWNAMVFGDHHRITLEMTRDQVKAAPQYQPGKPVVVLGAAADFAQSRLSERMPEQ